MRYQTLRVNLGYEIPDHMLEELNECLKVIWHVKEGS